MKGSQKRLEEEAMGNSEGGLRVSEDKLGTRKLEAGSRRTARGEWGWLPGALGRWRRLLWVLPRPQTPRTAGTVSKHIGDFLEPFP